MEKTTRLLADAKTALAKVADADKNALYLALVATVNAVESMTADPATAIPPAVADADAKAKADADAKAAEAP